MEVVFLKLLNMSITASWLVLAVVILRGILKKLPKDIRCILWAFVGIRLLWPFSLESVFSLIPSAETIPQDIIYTNEPAIQSGVHTINEVVNPVISNSLAPNIGDSVNPLQVITYIASILWIFGLVIVLLYAGISYLRIRKKVAASIRIKDNIYVCDYINTPFIFGIFRPRIYLPSTLDEDQANYVIAHEKAHLKRYDHWWKPLSFGLLSIYWFNPILWLSYILLCRDIELACDERVIKELGVSEKKSYSEAILFCSIDHKMITACPLAFGEVGVKERIKSVLRYKKPTFWVLVIAVIACSFIAVCFMTNPKERIFYPIDPFGHNYHVEEVIYDGNEYSSDDTMEHLPQYRFTSDFMMMCKGRVTVNEEVKQWEALGRMDEVDLSEHNFDQYFKKSDGVSGWKNNLTAYKLRRNNVTAWQLLVGDDGEALSYYLLQQKNGDIYLACWYYDSESEMDSLSDDSSMRWLLKLERADYVKCKVETPGNTSFLELPWYSDGQYDFQYETLPIATIEESGTLVFLVDEDCDRLTVEEDYYTFSNESTGFSEKETYTLSKNSDSEFVLEVGRRNHIRDESAIYYIPYKDGTYVFKVEFSSTDESENVDLLDTAVSEAILDYHNSDKNDGLIHCESHIIFDIKEDVIDTKQITAYALVMHQAYSTYGGELVSEQGSYIPTALTFVVDENDNYKLTEYWEPRDGSYYSSDIRKKFPKEAAESAMDTQQYVKQQEQECYDMALTQLAGSNTVDVQIEELLNTISSSLGIHSSPSDYIESHQSEYDQLVAYGEFTLRYCFLEFLKGDQTDLRGQIMASVCEDIITSWGQALLYDGVFATGQDWFHEFKVSSEGLAMQYSEDDIQKYYPASWLLLQLMKE